MATLKLAQAEVSFGHKDEQILRKATELELRKLGRDLMGTLSTDEVLVQRLYDLAVSVSVLCGNPIPSGFSLIFNAHTPAHFRDTKGRIYADDQSFGLPGKDSKCSK